MKDSRSRVLYLIIILVFSSGSLLFSQAVTAGPPEGTVQGKVTFQGKSGLPGVKPSEVVVSIEGFTYPVASTQTKELVVTNGAVLGQKDLTFSPHVLPIVAGSEVSFINDDKVFHNVHLKSPTYSLNFAQFPSAKAVRKVKFDKPDIVSIDCDVHSEMHAFILVKPNPFFALADRKNQFTLKNVSPGKYKLQAWHEKFEPVVKEITVTEGQTTTVELNLDKKK